MRKLVLLMGVILWLPWQVFAQNPTEQQLQNKYWVYRDKFRKQFVKVGPRPGESLTMDNVSTGKFCYNNKGRINFGDVTAFQGDYMGVLASEYYLLKQSAADPQALAAVANEIYFAIYAIQRVDSTGENYFDPLESKLQSPNGFFIRDDVPAGFYENWESMGDSIAVQHSNSGNGRKVYYDTIVLNPISLTYQRAFLGKGWNRQIPMWDLPNDPVYSERYPSYYPNSLPHNRYEPFHECFVRDKERFDHDALYGYGNTSNEMSTDQLVGILFGFKCVTKFVGADVVVDPDGTGPLPAHNLHQWIAELTDGFMDHISQTVDDIPYYDSYTIDGKKMERCAKMNEKPWYDPISSARFESKPFWCDACYIDSCFDWRTDVLEDPDNPILFSSGNYVLTNPVKNKFVDRGMTAYVFGYPLEKLGEELTGNDYPAVSMMLDIEEQGARYLLDAWGSAVTAATGGWGWEVGAITSPDLWSVATLGRPMQPSNPSWWRDFYNYIPKNSIGRDMIAHSEGSNMFIYLPAASGTWTHQDFYGLMDDYNTEWAEIIWGVLNDSKPMNSPSQYIDWFNAADCNGISGEDSDPFNQFTVMNSGSRRHTTGAENNYNGMDYMLLYNFYRIASNKYFTNLPNANDNDHYWNTENQVVTIKDNKCPCQSSKQFYTDQSYAKAHLTTLSTLKNDLPFRFTDYKTYKIQIPEWLTQNYVINSGGELHPKGDLTICNSTTIINSSGKLSTDDNIDNSYYKIITVSKGGKIDLKSDGILYVKNNTKVVIDDGARLIYNGGAKIYLDGPNAILEIKGVLELKGGATFSTLAGSNGRGYVKFNANWNYNNSSQYNLVATGTGNKFILDGGGNNTNPKLLEVTGNMGINTDWNLAEFKLLNCNAELGEKATISSNAVSTTCSTFWMKALPNEKYNGLYVCRTHTLDNITIDDARYGITFTNIGNQEILHANNITVNRTDGPVRVWGGGFKLSESMINGYSIANNGLGIDATGCNSYSFIGNSTIYGHRTNTNGFYPAFTSTAGVHYFGSNRLYIDKSTLQRHTNAVRMYGADLQLRCNQIYDYKEAAADMFDKTGLYLNQGYNNFDANNDGDYTMKLRRQNRLFVNDGYNNFTSTVQLDMAIVDINTNSQRVANPNYNYPSGPDLNRFAIPVSNNYFNTPTPSQALVCAPRLMYRQYVAWGNPVSNYYSLSTNTPATGFTTGKDNYCTEQGIHNNIQVKNYTPKPTWSPFGNFKDPATVTDNTTGGTSGTTQLVQRIHHRVFDLPTPNYALEMDSLALVLESIGQPVAFHNDNSGLLYTAYTIMHDALSRGVYDHVIPVSSSSITPIITKVLNTQQMLWNKAGDNQIFWSSFKYELIRDWAQVYRLAEHRSDAINKLNEAQTWVTEPNDLAIIDKWKCVNQAELTYLADTISYDSLIALYPCMQFPQAPAMVMSGGGTNTPAMTTAINNISDDRIIIIYPNPVSGQLTVELKTTDNETMQSVSITDLQGRNILNRSDNAAKQQIDVSGLANGVYTIKIITSQRQVLQTVNVMH